VNSTIQITKIMQSENKYERTFNRFELKYLLYYNQVEEFLSFIAPYVINDAYGGPDGSYKIISLYYDSSDLLCYREKIDGEKYRRKLRVRTYGNHSEIAFLEIKQRYNLTVQKRRFRASLPEILSYLDTSKNGIKNKRYDPTIEEANILVQKLRLEPKIVVSYNRTAFFDRFNKNLRITIDRNVRCRHIALNIETNKTKGRYALQPEMMILEIKFNESIPTWIVSCLNYLDLQVQRISKYCNAIENLQMYLPITSRRPDVISLIGALK